MNFAYVVADRVTLVVDATTKPAVDLGLGGWWTIVPTHVGIDWQFVDDSWQPPAA